MISQLHSNSNCWFSHQYQVTFSKVKLQSFHPASAISWHPMECPKRANGAPSKLPPSEVRNRWISNDLTATLLSKSNSGRRSLCDERTDGASLRQVRAPSRCRLHHFSKSWLHRVLHFMLGFRFN